ncbi:MAG TPA: ABC transporter permease, partial [Roseivirga sp.]
MKKTSPPAWVDRMLEFFCSERFLEEVEGDLYEWFLKRVEKQGLRKAQWFYFFDAITYLRLFRLKTIKEMQRNNNKLYLNYLIIAIRQFKKSLWHSSLNVFGLAIGLLSTIFISTYVLGELSYDRFHQEHEKIYRLVNYDPANGYKSDATPSPWAIYLEPAFPEIESYTRLGQDIVLVNKGDQNFLENDFYWAESNFLTFFSFDIVHGDPSTMLKEPNSVVITKDIALKYFNKLDVVGQQLPIKVYDGNQDFLMKVTGVIENVPSYSHLQFELLGSMSTTKEMYGNFDRVWGLNWLKSYVKINQEASIETIKARLPEFFENYRGEGSSEYSDIIFQPLDKVRLYSNDVNGKIAKGNLNYVILFACVALLILVASAINYVNLVTAKSGQRGKEIGMRKVLGAQRSEIVRQVYVESFFQLFLALVLAYAMALLLLPVFNQIVDKQIVAEQLISSQVNKVVAWAILFILIFSGAYPAIVLNRYKPIDSLRGTHKNVMGNRSAIRKVQVFFQFTIGIFLICCTLVVIKQVRFFSSFDKGFNAEQL